MTSHSEKTALFDTYARADLHFDRGEGARLFTREGDEYLDFAGGIAVSSMGHSNSKIVGALKAQADKLWHLSNMYEIDGQTDLAERLCAATFADKVFFTNSGAEANECAIKTARRFHYVNGSSERIDIITFEGAFHGRTLATISAGGQEKYLEGFGPKLPGFVQVPFGDMAALKSAISSTTAALMIEPIQGEGGLRPVENDQLIAMRELCDEHGILLILDEIQCGVGRTGKLFAHEWSGISPDIMAIAKGIGAGFPMGACLTSAEAAKGMTLGTHGTTFGGNPLGMAVGGAVLDLVLADGFLAKVADTGLYLSQKLAELCDTHKAKIDGVRGKGLMIGICLNKNYFPDGAAPAVRAARTHKILTVAAGQNVMRLLPPLIITNDDVDEAIDRLNATFTEL